MPRHPKSAASRPASPGPARSASGRPRAQRLTSPGVLLAALGVALVTGAAYLGALDHQFVNWDDFDYVVNNPLVLARDFGALLTAAVSNHFHPLTMWSLAANVSQPLAWHPFIATNVALHLINTLLVFALAFRLSGRRTPVAALVALLFGIHPLHVESVAWIAERKDVLYTACFLAAALAYLRYLERRTPALLALTFVLFVLSCLAKEMAAAFPLVMLLLDHWTGRRLLEPRALLEKLPFLAMAALSGWIVLDLQAGRDFHGLLRVVGERAVVLSAPPGFSFLERLTLPTYGYLMYLVRLFVPVDLCAFYPYPGPAELRTLPFLVAPLVFVGTLAVAAWDARRTRVLSFGIGWFLVTLVLVLRWIPAGQVIMGDRYAYVSSIGVFFALAMGVHAVAERRPALRVPVWALAALFSAWLFALLLPQIATWRDSEALWSRVMERYPRLGVAYVYRGKHRFEHGRVVEAQSDFRTAYDLGTRSGEVYGGLGITYGALGKPDSALAMLDQAVALMPERAAAYENRAIAYVGVGRAAEALADLDRAQALGLRETPTLHTTRGYARLRLGDPRAALAEFERSLTLGARDQAALYGRGLCRLQLGDRAGAAEDFRETLRLNPGYSPAREHLRTLEP